jgi:prophage maintenance system killer protein
MSITLLTLDDCQHWLFPLIRRHMAGHEPAPDYAHEPSGLKRLESILSLANRAEYPDLLSKAAYIFCAIIDGHPYSNGNKRLAVACLCATLVLNSTQLSEMSLEAVREQLKWLFPKLQWQEVEHFTLPHEYFFYHLALVIADRQQKGGLSFQQEQAAVRHLLQFVTA